MAALTVVEQHGDGEVLAVTCDAVPFADHSAGGGVGGACGGGKYGGGEQSTDHWDGLFECINQVQCGRIVVNVSKEMSETVCFLDVG